MEQAVLMTIGFEQASLGNQRFLGQGMTCKPPQIFPTGWIQKPAVPHAVIALMLFVLRFYLLCMEFK